VRQICPCLDTLGFGKKTAATGHLNAKRMPMSDSEDVLVFYRHQPVYNPQGLTPHGKTVRRGGNGGCYGKSGKENFQEFTNYPRRTLEIQSQGGTTHPTQKPVALMEYLICTYTNEGETVLDFTMGSGTTGVACKNLGRSFIGIEMDADYFAAASARIDGTPWQTEA
jgi:site-specific DNA-methyltransferase (adenine-specific)